jgi:uncharacterized protein YkwD
MNRKYKGAIVIRLIFLTVLGLAISIYHAGAQSAGMEREILRLVNKHRAKKGLSALENHGSIAAAADKHSRSMASRRTMSHAGFDGRTDKLLKSINGANAAAENVAYGSKTAEAVVNMWLNSKGHRKNIEGNFNLTGIGIARSRDGVLYYTQIFINKK